MKLHRLTLTNYRGITHRDITFPDSGVIVISGANEVGKSSMLEALDLLLESKDRSTKKDVKQVKPTHADVGAEVTAEMSAGAYRFVYRKRFHKKPETELTILAPRREQLTGDEAHERVRAILAETVDLLNQTVAPLGGLAERLPKRLTRPPKGSGGNGHGDAPADTNGYPRG